MNWKPMETAPMDGTRILLYRSGWAENVCVGYYLREFDMWSVAAANSPFLKPEQWCEIVLP